MILFLKKYPPEGNVKPLLLLGTVWSDGFDANNVVHSAPSIWMRTVTIAPPHNMTTSTKHTFILHMSKEGVCHEKIDKLFDQELQELENGMWFYSTLIQKPIFVIFKVHVYAADRPERGKLTHVLGHTGVTTKRWLYSAYLPPSKMQSCDVCFQYRVKIARDNPTYYFASNRRCGRCADWNFDHPVMKVDVPDGYPTSCHMDSPSPHNTRQVERVRHLYPMVLSFENMIANAKFIYFNVYKQAFSINNAKTFGRASGLSGDCIKNTCIAQAKQLREQHPNLPRAEIIKRFEYPQLWRSCIQLNQYIDAPMHLIFQGIIKSLIEMISEWLIALSTGSSYYRKFCKIIHPLMVSISSMNLSWCVLNTLNTSKNYKPTGWIASNYLAFARLMLIFYRYIRHVLPQSEAGLLECEAMIQSGLCLVSYIMSKHNNNPTPIMEYTKLFLSCVDKFEAKVYVITSIQPIWRSRGNFLSLLNLPLQQQYFGNVRNFWEGERERFIQHVKPLLANLRHSTSFLVTKVERLYQSIALDHVLETIPNRVSQNIINSTYERNNEFIVYKDIESVNKHLNDKKPISGIEICIQQETNTMQSFCVVLKEKDQKFACYRIKMSSPETGYKRCALFYVGIDLFVPEINIIASYETKSQLQSHIKHMILLIPNMADSKERDYTIVSDEWLYLNDDLSLGFSRIQQNLFCEL